MALSGSASKGFARHSLIIEWSATQSIANNNSTVTAKVYLQSNDQYGAMDAPATNYGSVTVNGVTKSFSATSNLSANQKKLLTTQTFTVGHNADGTKSFSFSVTYNINVTFAGVFYGDQTASGTGTLNTIPRASSITSISGGTLGSPVTVTIARASSSFTHAVGYYRSDGSYGGSWLDVEESLTFTPSINDSIYITDGASALATIVVDTMSGSRVIGSTRKTFTVTVPEGIKPFISDISITDMTPYFNKFGGFVQGRSEAKVSMVGNGIYASRIIQKRISGNGRTSNDYNLYTGFLNQAGKNTFDFEVTDSRGRKGLWSSNIDVVPYSTPVAKDIWSYRCNADGTPNNDGTYVKVGYDASISPINNKNDKFFIYRWRTGNGAWTEQALSNKYYDIKGSVVLAGFDLNSSYQLQLLVIDSFVSVIRETTVSTAFTIINIHSGGKGIAFGGVMERAEGLDVLLDTKFKKPITIQTETLGQPDDGVARIKRMNNTLASFISLDSTRESLKLHMYGADGMWKSYFEFYENGNFLPSGKIINENKKLLPLLNGWKEYGDIYQSPYFWKDKNDVVHIGGLTCGGTTKIGTVIAQLPIGYRPLSREIFSVWNVNNSIRVDVNMAGQIMIQSENVMNSYLSLSGISFRGER